jgi:ribosomal protein S18 acetylase RimI-like enzyme
VLSPSGQNWLSAPPTVTCVATIATVTDVLVRAVPVAETRQLRQAVLRPNDTLEQLASHEPDTAFAVGAFDGEELIAAGFVAPDGEVGEWRIRGMATAPHARSRGTGTLVLEELLRHATAHGARRIWCNARAPARSFYERLGLRVVSEPFEIPGIGPHFVMELTPLCHGMTESSTSAPSSGG